MSSESTTADDLEEPHDVAHMVPSDQPNRVHELADRLLNAYQIDDGNIKLAGCTLDDVPVVHFRSPAEETMNHVFWIFGQANPQGRRVDRELFETLGLGNLAPFQRPTTVSPQEMNRLIEAARRVSGPTSGSTERPVGTSEPPREPVVEIIWCKYARGKIRFTVGNATADTTFAGWARTIVAPPFHCEASGTDTFSIVATSDGRLVAADQIGQCEVSRRRLPVGELVRCAATNRLVATDLTARCPVSGERVLQSELVECPTCRQAVSPLAISGNRCGGCRRLTTVRGADQRLAKVLAAHPQLSDWQWLRVAETEAVYIVTASKWIDQRLLVLDKQSLELLHAATGTRLTPNWTEVPKSQYAELLG